ncbi:hypothetical protein SJA_C1-12910 [Sphingobium indicum UT26S]|uniref:Uncharacterized protein n=1 Tax=Sphingobium indicum (strain DSM 16413 / CCM 7287 / MTCC 6362 / UT26 / NBRC 101211 / UT26S) TaxID=452662 RepID=D4Z0J3_SPHIU|nr:hypothetical protein SJA_C1-12910 [Sphingobium indicum UT26S]
MGRGTGRRLVEGKMRRSRHFPSTPRFASGPPPHAARREDLVAAIGHFPTFSNLSTQSRKSRKARKNGAAVRFGQVESPSSGFSPHPPFLRGRFVAYRESP